MAGDFNAPQMIEYFCKQKFTKNIEDTNNILDTIDICKTLHLSLQNTKCFPGLMEYWPREIMLGHQTSLGTFQNTAIINISFSDISITLKFNISDYKICRKHFGNFAADLNKKWVLKNKKIPRKIRKYFELNYEKAFTGCNIAFFKVRLVVFNSYTLTEEYKVTPLSCQYRNTREKRGMK